MKQSKLKASKANQPGQHAPNPQANEIHSCNFSPAAQPKDQAKADFWLHPATAAASVIARSSLDAMPEINADALAKNLREAMRPEAYKENSLAMLYGQAVALQTMFVHLSRRAMNQDMLKQYETHMRLALRAQNQCRMTLETLSNVQNPPVVFAKQANINNGGQQQVNNGAEFPESLKARTHTSGENEAFKKSELLENHHGERLDFGAQATAGRIDQGMAAMGKIDGPEVRRG